MEVHGAFRQLVLVYRSLWGHKRPAAEEHGGDPEAKPEQATWLKQHRNSGRLLSLIQIRQENEPVNPERSLLRAELRILYLLAPSA